MRLRILMIVACTFVAASGAHAQTDFTAVTLAPGDVVRVTQPTGEQLTGVVTDLSPTLLTIGGVALKPEPGLRVERSGDSIWNGLGIGFVAGAVLGASFPRRGCFDGATLGCVVAPGLVFGALGALLDRARVGRTTVFIGKRSTSATLIPLLSSDAKGLMLPAGFCPYRIVAAVPRDVRVSICPD